MKKFVALLLTFTMLFLMVGCDKFSLTENSSTTTTTEPVSSGETTTNYVEERLTQESTTDENTTAPATSTETTTKESTTKSEPTTNKTSPTTTNKPTTTSPTTTKAETTTKAPDIALTGSKELHFPNGMSKIINDEFLRLVNEERKKCGVQQLTVNNTLMSAAKTRGSESVQYYSHTRPDGTSFSTVLDESKHYYNYSTTGENLGRVYYYGYQDVDLQMNYTNEQLKEVAKTFFDGWKNSPGHYENMISSSFTETGFYFIRYYDEKTGEYGTIGVHLFGSQ